MRPREKGDTRTYLHLVLKKLKKYFEYNLKKAIIQKKKTCR